MTDTGRELMEDPVFLEKRVREQRIYMINKAADRMAGNIDQERFQMLLNNAGEQEKYFRQKLQELYDKQGTEKVE